MTAMTTATKKNLKQFNPCSHTPYIYICIYKRKCIHSHLDHMQKYKFY